MTSRETLDRAYAQTRDIYERQAAGWDGQRSRILYERPWLARFAGHLPQGGRIADLGCGAGEPIAAWFIEQGFALTGVDFSESMLEICRTRYPSGDWVQADIRDWRPAQPFDGLISWDGFFHLTMDEQRAFLKRLPDLVMLNGVILMTVGHIEGEVTGTVEGELVYHASLFEEEYRSLLQSTGFRDIIFVAEDPSLYGRTVLMARRS